MSNSQGICFNNSADVRHVREVLDEANYSETGIHQFLGDKVPPAPIAAQLPQMTLRTNGGSPLETFVRLFLLNVATDVDSLKRAIRPMDLNQWVDGGLVQVQGQSAVPLVRILPYAGLLIACDIPGNDNGTADFVMGLGGSSLTLLNSIIRQNVESALDLGSGCGIQSFLLARHSQNVCGVDRNPRAIQFAQFNAQLNDIDDVDFIHGDLFEPVSGRTFDLVVTNPPFVISPDFRAHYRDSGHVADAFCQKIVQQVPAFLNEGGVFQMIFNWAHTTGQRWQDRLASWCENSGCDAWVMRKETRDPSEYALFWNRDEVKTAGFADTYECWMSWYEQQGIEAISTGLITMRRNGRGSNWFRADDAPERTSGSIGKDIFQIFETSDWLQSLSSDEDLLATRFKLATDVCLDQQLIPTSRGWRVETGRLRRPTGLGYTGQIDPETAGLLSQCNGENTFGDLLVALAQRRGASVEKIAPVYLAVLRRLLSRAFILPTSNKEFSGQIPSTDDVEHHDQLLESVC